MKNQTNVKKAADKKTTPADPVKQTSTCGDYTHYFYKSIQLHDQVIKQLYDDNQKLAKELYDLRYEFNRLCTYLRGV